MNRKQAEEAVCQNDRRDRMVADIDNLEDSDNRVVLMTLHSAKRSGISMHIYLWYGRWNLQLYDGDV